MAFDTKYSKYMVYQIELVSVTKNVKNFIIECCLEVFTNTAKYTFRYTFHGNLYLRVTDALKLSFFITIYMYDERMLQ